MTTAIDLFAGLGGFTSGAEAAGVRVLWAATRGHRRAAVPRSDGGWHYPTSEPQKPATGPDFVPRARKITPGFTPAGQATWASAT